MKRIILAILSGSIAVFVIGFLFYVVLLGGFYEANLGTAPGVVREVPVPWALVISQLGLASVLTYVLVNADVRSAFGGLRAGAAFGLLYGIAISFDLFAVTNWSNVNVALVEPLVTAARMAAVGSLVGWVLGNGPRLASRGDTTSSP